MRHSQVPTVRMPSSRDLVLPKYSPTIKHHIDIYINRSEILIAI